MNQKKSEGLADYPERQVDPLESKLDLYQERINTQFAKLERQVIEIQYQFTITSLIVAGLAVAFLAFLIETK